MAHGVRVLHPERGETTVEELIGDLGLGAKAHAERPYVIVNFASTLDGHATIAGRSGPIGTATDTAVLQRLRTQADAVMIGAGTMRTERYGRMVPDAEQRTWRERIGLAPDPLAVIVSGRLDLPWDAGLFADGHGSCLIATSSPAEPPPTATRVEVLRQEQGLRLGDLLRHLRTEHGIRSLLCEGGPTVHAELLAAGLVDEHFLTIAPKLAGGGGPRIVEGELPAVSELALVWLLESDGELFARYRAGP